MKTIQELYTDYPEIPYISPDRDLAEINFTKPVPKRNMVRTAEGLLPGHIILLWRINFGTFTTETTFSKYFEYTYGVNGRAALNDLIAGGYAVIERAFESLDHLSAQLLKAFLKEKGVKGLSKMKRADVDEALAQHFSEEELGTYFSLRGIKLTDKGRLALANNQAVIDKHPKKKLG